MAADRYVAAAPGDRMLASLLLAPAFAADARLVWRGGVGRVEIVAPGEHVSPDAPTTVRVGELRVETRGDPAALRFPVAAGPLGVEVSLALCTDGSTACRPVRFGAAGVAAGPRGELALVEGGSGGFADADAHDAVRPAAPPRGNGLRVLDFGAVWCPPCNLMEAEVLHDPAGTAGVPVETIDVDQPASWPLKDRYAVGGYPTLVAVDAEGREIDRLVGYPGAAETRAWFARLDDGLLPIHRLAEIALDPKSDTLSGEFASGAARRLAEAERSDAARALFPKAADTVDLRVARLLVEPTEADARWLFAHDAPPGDWVFAAVDTVPALWAEAAALAPDVDPVRGADFLYVAAEHAPKETAPALHAAALALLRAALTGDPDKDRGHATFLATLLVETGDLDGALALLDAHAARWPEEFTFTFAAARHLLDAGRLPEAEARARAAYAKSWGDQRLRAASLLAKVLAARGQRPEAVLVIDGALREVPAPPPDLAVRTTRYRADLDKLRAELSAPAAPAPSKPASSK